MVVGEAVARHFAAVADSSRQSFCGRWTVAVPVCGRPEGGQRFVRAQICRLIALIASQDRTQKLAQVFTDAKLQESGKNRRRWVSGVRLGELESRMCSSGRRAGSGCAFCSVAWAAAVRNKYKTTLVSERYV